MRPRMCDAEHPVLEPLDRRSDRPGRFLEATQIAGERADVVASMAVPAEVLEQIVVGVNAVEGRVASDAFRGGTRADRRRNAEEVRRRAWLLRVGRTLGPRLAGDRPSGPVTRSANGTINASHLDARHAVRGRHANRQSRRHHGPGASRAARSGAHRRRRHAAHGASARAVRASRRRRPASTSTTNSGRRRHFSSGCGADEDIALVSDAGTPTVSDPGQQLVRAQRSMRAFASSLSRVRAPRSQHSLLPGFPASTFVFLGFPPVRSKDRTHAGSMSWLERDERSSFSRLPTAFERHSSSYSVSSAIDQSWWLAS